VECGKEAGGSRRDRVFQDKDLGWNKTGDHVRSKVVYYSVTPIRKGGALTIPSLPAAGRNKELMLSVSNMPSINAGAF
jgi:hypothetical protein